MKHKNMISTKEFDKMKPNAILINAARGGIVDEKALYEALKNIRFIQVHLMYLQANLHREKTGCRNY